MNRAILVVSFGTSFHDTLEKNILAIENDLDSYFTDRKLYRAFTSGMIMKKLRERDGIIIDNVAEAMARMLDEGITDVLLQPSHVLNGEEYDKLCALAQPYADKFEVFKIGAPLLTEVEDYHCVARAIIADLPEKCDDTAIVFMGHGTEHHANAVYPMLEYVLHDFGRGDIFIGTVEGYPALDEVLRRISEYGGVKKIIALPFMIVAGDHATNDLAGEDEDSWKSVLEAQGFEVTCILKGLGENAEIRKIFVQHAENAK